MAQEEQRSVNALAAERTDLAVERTVMAASRTLMAWVRTGLSLISFGFTIYKFLQVAKEGFQAEGAKLAVMQVHGPRRFGLILIALGIMSVIMGSIEYFQTVKRLDTMSERKYKPFNYAFVMASVVGVLGILLFVGIALHSKFI